MKGEVPVQTNNWEAMTVIIKVAAACPLGCPHCYYFYQREQLGQQRAGIMDTSILESALRQILESGVPNIFFVWHGGEPLLAKREFYVKAIELQEKYRRPEQYIENGIQTSGVGLTPEFATFAKVNGLNIGVSLDGPPEIHDAQRPLNNGGGSYSEVERTIRLLQKEWADEFGVLCTVTPLVAESPDKVFRFFVDELGLKKFDFIPAQYIPE